MPQDGSSAADAAHDPDPYKARRKETKFRKKPYCVYFYHVGAKDPDTGRRPVKYYYYSEPNAISRGEFERIAVELGVNARREPGAPPSHGSEPDQEIWIRKSYIMILVDDPTARFGTPMLKVEQTESANGGVTYPNHSFYDAEEFRVELPSPDGGTETCQVVVCTNHMKRDVEGNDQLPKDLQHYKFTLNFDPPEGPGFLPDSGGTNQGGPIPPPE